MPCPSAEDSTVTISSGSTSASIHSFGATVVSWCVGGQERLFVSSKAIWDGSKPIRGGIPLVFPQFGTGPIMAGQHGFARTQVWQLEKTASDTLRCTLRDGEATRSVWPHQFCLTYTVTVAEGRLMTKMAVDNPASAPEAFKFTALLHTYLAIGDITSAQVEGFHGLSYQDKLLAGQVSTEQRDKINVQQEVDRTYVSVPGPIMLHTSRGQMEIVKEGFADVVLWNPWVEKSKAMADFDDEEYKQMLCIEVGQVTTPVELAPGSTWSGSQSLIVK